MESVIKAEYGYKVKLKTGDFPIIAWSVFCKQVGGSYLNSVVVPIIPVFDLSNNDDGLDLLHEISHADIICPDGSVIDKDNFSILHSPDSQVETITNTIKKDEEDCEAKTCDISQTDIVRYQLKRDGLITVSDMISYGIKSPSSCMSKLKKAGIKFVKNNHAYVLVS